MRFCSSRNMEIGQPSRSSDCVSARLAGGHELAASNLCPLKVKIRVPSFLTKSGSSTPWVCTLVVVYDAGGGAADLGVAEGAPPAVATPPHIARQLRFASRLSRISTTAASWMARSTAGQGDT